jgi:alpha-1,6-mannosyltransferase
MSLAYGVMLARVWRESHATRPLLLSALLFAVVFRLAPAVAPVGPDNDMVRYLWDGRVQRLGYNPYTVVPADPSLAHTHVNASARMPSRFDRTPYPPVAQLFFRLVVTAWDSTLAMKLALVACDLLTIGVLWRWLMLTGRSEWLVLTYAWNPLVVLDVAHSGHLDALGVLFVAASAYWLTARRTLAATLSFVCAIGVKLVPIVLAPLVIGRIRGRDAVIGAACLAALYLPFTAGLQVPLGAVPNVVDRVRFNGPVFAALAWVLSPRYAAVIALLLGIGAALWARRHLAVADPAGWAWPMAIAIACAPVIYPWYLLYFTPFLFTTATLPLMAWSLSGLSVYVVWDLSRHGSRWTVPGWVTAFEFASLIATSMVVAAWSRIADNSPRHGTRI